jgi:hypothetical protein
MRENSLQSKCLSWLGEHHPDDVLPANVHGGGWSIKGFPDVLCCIKGRYVAFELKVGENEMDAAQRIWRNRILKAGGSHYCPRSLEAFIEAVEKELEVAYGSQLR